MSNSFNLMAENPNLATGSNGCLCSELGNSDTAGPFIVFIGTETDNIHAPFPVICADCVSECAKLISADESYQERYKDKPQAPAPRRPTHAKRSVDDGDGPTI